MSVSERRGALRESLVAAAGRAISERGVTGLKARELARETGCALGAIYNVFPDLDALVLAVNAKTLAELEAALRRAAASGGKGRAAASGGKGRAAAAVDELVRLADAYLEFAAANGQRWRALFEHRSPPGKELPQAYAEQQTHLFSFIVAPLIRLRPDLDEEERALLARTLFSAVHGIVSMGLEEKLVPIPLPLLRLQMEEVVRAIGRGLGA
jgi:AcrR family transcriptional regulator